MRDCINIKHICFGKHLRKFLWLEMLEKLSQRIEILKTEQANLQNQMAQASNNATNAVVANQQKQQQAYQQTGSTIQAVTSNTFVMN